MSKKAAATAKAYDDALTALVDVTTALAAIVHIKASPEKKLADIAALHEATRKEWTRIALEETNAHD